MKSQAIPLSIAVLGVGVLLSPVPLPGKLLAGISGITLCSYQMYTLKGLRNRQSSLEQRRKVELKAQEAELKAKEQEIESNFTILAIAQEDLERKRVITEKELEQAREDFERQIGREQDLFLAELADEERRQKKQLEVDLEANRTAVFEQMNQDIQAKQVALDALSQQYQEKGNQLEEEYQQRLGLVEAEIERKRQEWELEREQKRQADSKELEEAENALANAYMEQRDNLAKELEVLQQELQSQAKANYQAWLAPHCQEMDAKIREIEALKSTIDMLRDQIAEDRDIKLSQEPGTVHGDRANAVLLWLKEQGIYCDYESSIVLPDGTFVLNFLPWEVGAKAERRIKGLLLACQVKFGLQEPPSFQPNGEARTWSLTLFPARARAIALSDFYIQQLPETNLGESFRDIEPTIREGVARQLNYEQQVQEMMNFIPPVPLAKPRSHQLTELEMMCCKWFFSWRGLATNGEKPNVTTREGLLWHIFGIREGRGSSTYDPLLCESLGQRVSRILKILKVESVEMLGDNSSA